MAAFLLLMLFWHPKLIITPAKPDPIAAGTTLQFKSNVPVKWSLAPGSPGTIDASGLYHAPAHVPAHNQLAGCQLLPNDHILNTRIDALPIHPKSAGWIAMLPGNRLNYYESWGINIADSSTPVENMHLLYDPENDGKYEIPAWPDLQRENGVFGSPHSGLDRHVVVVDRQSCKVFELYNNYAPGENASCPACTAQGGVAYSSMTYGLPNASSDAAGLFLAPLSLHLSEMYSGQILHALRFTLANAYVAPSSNWPSRAHAGAWGRIPYGTRFRLRAGYDISGFTPAAQILLTQLKQYGIILADGGANWQIETGTDVTLNPAVESALREIEARGPHKNDMEAVDESSLMISEDSGRINPDNSYVKDDGSATIIATGLQNPDTAASARIAIRSVTVGVPQPAVWIQSGVQTQLTGWVNGSSNKSINWSMSPALGTLSSSGAYSAPEVERPATTMLTAASAADPEAKVRMTLTILPAGPIRVDVAGSTHAPGAPNAQAPNYGPDSEGHMWWRDQAGEVSWGVLSDGWSEGNWPKQKDIGLFYTSRYSMGDMLYRFLVPNGNYKINIYFAKTGCTGTFPKGQIGPIHVETQGRIVLHDFDPGLSVGYNCATPSIDSIPATVTDHSLYFALRRVTTEHSHPTPLLNAFSIVPDQSAPRITLNPTTPPDVLAGGTLHLYALGWYMNSEVNWSLEGPGTISPEGLYHSPAVPPNADTKVTVEAHSKADPAKSAAVQFTLKSSPLEIAPPSATIARSLSQPFKLTFGQASYSNATWTLSPNIGSISPEGVYTAPASLPEDTKVTITARSKDLPDRTATATVDVEVNPEVIRIHCGEGPAFKDAQGNLWAEDHGYSKDTVANREAAPIAGAPPDMQYLYQSSRYRYAGEPFTYHFDVPNGRYAVTLKFADYGHKEAADYHFDVKLNGRKVLTSFNPDEEKGARTAVDKTFETDVKDKQIQLDFLASKDAAFINGIEIRYLGPAQN